MTDKLAWIDEELANLKETGFYNTIPTMDSPQGASVVINGKRVLNFCANNYLGLANHPRLVKQLPKPCKNMALVLARCGRLPVP